MRPDSPGHPVGYKGFYNPANQSAISVWEDPSQVEIKSWNPLKSFEDLKYQIKLSVYFIERIISMLSFFSPLSFAIVLSYLVLLTPWNRSIFNNEQIYPIVTIFIYTFGYTLILPVERYLWIDYLLLLLMGGVVLQHFFNNNFFNSFRRRLALILFASCFLFHPIINLGFEINKGKDIYELSQLLKNKYNIKGNIASHGHYKRPLYLSFYLNCKYFGTARNGIGCEELYNDLKTNDIDYFFVWKIFNEEFDDLKQECNGLLNFTEITKGEIPELRIYDIKSRP